MPGFWQQLFAMGHQGQIAIESRRHLHAPSGARTRFVACLPHCPWLLPSAGTRLPKQGSASSVCHLPTRWLDLLNYKLDFVTAGWMNVRFRFVAIALVILAQMTDPIGVGQQCCLKFIQQGRRCVESDMRVVAGRWGPPGSLIQMGAGHNGDDVAPNLCDTMPFLNGIDVVRNVFKTVTGKNSIL